MKLGDTLVSRKAQETSDRVGKQREYTSEETRQRGPQDEFSRSVKET